MPHAHSCSGTALRFHSTEQSKTEQTTTAVSMHAQLCSASTHSVHALLQMGTGCMLTFLPCMTCICPSKTVDRSLPLCPGPHTHKGVFTPLADRDASRALTRYCTPTTALYCCHSHCCAARPSAAHPRLKLALQLLVQLSRHGRVAPRQYGKAVLLRQEPFHLALQLLAVENQPTTHW